ncbi:hypothetical protein KUCAC02_007771 [Chaenocephalus aceratus]|uniref:Uncharacterized protein n=1 Tax=Chaenocephalus aceratus TaxID=36190 RepID=A0ACB9X7F0_CHAAC|nr:hypothetical protein KUCAC02_007771 [Chaenocephalus aceratus]
MDSEDSTVLPESKKKNKEQSEKQEEPNEKVCTASSNPTVGPVEETASNEKPFHVQTTKSMPRRWEQSSVRWREKLEKLVSTDESEETRIGSMIYVDKEEFCIAQGSNGTDVFLGLKDDGTEVAIKKMYKRNYALLKCEEKFLRHPALDHPFIVKYIDFAEDKNFGYLVLQLCEYTLKEHIETHDDEEERKKLVSQVARMVIYYVLSGGHHPFGDISYECENNIVKGNYTLEHVQDVLAKDLIERMIDAEPKNRPKVEECLNHPFFWKHYRKVEYLKKIGNRKEVARYKDADQEFISSLDECAGDGAFNGWKHMVTIP